MKPKPRGMTRWTPTACWPTTWCAPCGATCTRCTPLCAFGPWWSRMATPCTWPGSSPTTTSPRPMQASSSAASRKCAGPSSRPTPACAGTASICTPAPAPSAVTRRRPMPARRCGSPTTATSSTPHGSSSP